MIVGKLWIIIISLILVSCYSKKAQVVIPESIVRPLDVAGLRDVFEKTIGHKVYFAFDSAALSAGAENQLKKQAEWLVDNSTITVIIEGHCDNRGSIGYNFNLGLRRAEAVSKFLIAQGVDQKRLAVISYGKGNPEYKGNNQKAHRLNRRAVTSVIISAVSNVE